MDKDAVVKAIIALKNCATGDFAEQSHQIEKCNLGNDEDALIQLYQLSIGLLGSPETQLEEAAIQIVEHTESFLEKLGVCKKSILAGKPVTTQLADSMNHSTISALANFKQVAGMAKQ